MVVRSEASFFSEWDLVKSFIADICEDNWKEVWDSKWEYVSAALLIFQEQPTLLTPYLENIIIPLTNRLTLILQFHEQSLNRFQVNLSLFSNVT